MEMEMGMGMGMVMAMAIVMVMVWKGQGSAHTLRAADLALIDNNGNKKSSRALTGNVQLLSCKFTFLS